MLLELHVAVGQFLMLNIYDAVSCRLDANGICTLPTLNVGMIQVLIQIRRLVAFDRTYGRCNVSNYTVRGGGADRLGNK